MTSTTSAFAPSAADVQRLNKAIRWSMALHVGAVAALFLLPRTWFIAEPEKRNIMTISLGGTPGPRSSGTTSIGGRTIEEVAPPPKRPEPVRPTPPKASPAAAVAKPTPPPPQATQKPDVSPRPVTPATRPPVTGQQIVQGNTAVETGARGQGAGLTFGGGGTGGETDLSNFCCPDYLQHLLSTIESRWAKTQPERGTTTLKFTVQRNGSIDNITVEVPSGYGALDRAARAALLDARLLPLPTAYPNATLTIHLKFPYGTQ